VHARELSSLLRFVEWGTVLDVFPDILRAYETRTPHGLFAMHGLVSTVMWRTTNAMAAGLNLPPLTIKSQVRCTCVWCCCERVRTCTFNHYELDQWVGGGAEGVCVVGSGILVLGECARVYPECAVCAVPCPHPSPPGPLRTPLHFLFLFQEVRQSIVQAEFYKQRCADFVNRLSWLNYDDVMRSSQPLPGFYVNELTTLRQICCHPDCVEDLGCVPM
jgi:hypothetical protein